MHLPLASQDDFTYFYLTCYYPKMMPHTVDICVNKESRLYSGDSKTICIYNLLFRSTWPPSRSVATGKPPRRILPSLTQGAAGSILPERQLRWMRAPSKVDSTIDQTAFIGSTFLSPPHKLIYVTSGGANATNELFKPIVAVRVKVFSQARLRMIRSSTQVVPQNPS